MELTLWEVKEETTENHAEITTKEKTEIIEIIEIIENHAEIIEEIR